MCPIFFSECDEFHPCQGLGEHAHFRSFGMAFLTLFRIATGDNWNGIMKDTLREECEDGDDCLQNCCVSPYFAPLFFVVFVLMAQFVLVNVVVAVLMKHLEESHKQVCYFLAFVARYYLLMMIPLIMAQILSASTIENKFPNKVRNSSIFSTDDGKIERHAPF